MKKLNFIILFFLSFYIIPLYGEEPAFIPERFLKLMTPTLTVEWGWSAPCVYDWNNDGNNDLLVGSGAGKIFVYINQGNNSSPRFSTPVPIQYQGGDLIVSSSYNTLFAYMSATSDLDGDGLNDLLVGAYNKIYLYKNTGSAGAPVFNTDKQQIQFVMDPWGLVDDNIQNDVGAYELIGGAKGITGAAPVAMDLTGDGTIDILSAYSYIDSSGYVHHCVVLYTNSGTTTSNNFTSMLDPFGGFGGSTTNLIKLPIDITNGNFSGEFIHMRNWFVFPCIWNGDAFPDLVGSYYTAPENDRLDGVLAKNMGAEKVKFVWIPGPLYNAQFPILTTEGKDPVLPMQNPIFVSDWDGDAKQEILAGSILGNITVFERVSDNVVSVINDYRQNIQLTSEDNGLYGSTSVSINVLDYNSDGYYDILFGNIYSRCFYVLNEGNNQKPLFRFIRPITIGTGIYERTPVRNVSSFPDFFDWNRDGKKDFIFGGGRSEEFVVFTNINNNTDPVFATNVNVIQAGGANLLTPGGYSVCTPVDWESDGDTDLITIGEDGVFVKYLSTGNDLLALGEGNALRYENNEIMSLGWISSKPYFVDWDGDGDDDLIGAAQGKIYIFINEGNNITRKFTEKRELEYAGETMSADIYPHISVLDLNKDGYLDIIKGTPLGEFEIYYGGPARFVGLDETLMPEDRVIPFPNPVRKDYANRIFSDRYYINNTPFGTETMNIGFSVRDDAVVEIYVYTLGGKPIEKIYGDAKYNYKNIALFNIEDIANGIYIIKIKATSKANKEEDTVTKKISVIR
ncbi:MAG: VCBS repeat-containing protein [Spirochaetes bacterium]|nr:VCBS repeat-containing protein [Spirochaetota bacterium]